MNTSNTAGTIPEVRDSSIDHRLIDAICKEDWNWLTFLADGFKDAVESVGGLDENEDIGERGRGARIQLGHAEVIAALKKNADEAQVIVSHHFGQLLNIYCPNRKDGRRSKNKPSEDRTVLIDGQEVNFDQILRDCGGEKREREWDLRKAGSRSTGEFLLWVNDQRAKNKKPTLGGWLSEIKKKERLERRAMRAQRSLEAHTEMERAGELGRMNEWASFFNCRFQELHKHAKIPALDAIITDPPYDRAAIDLNLFEDLAEFADKNLKPAAPLVMMVGHCHLPAIIKQVESKGFFLRWFLTVKYNGENHLGQPYAVNSKCKPVLVFQRESERKEDVQFGSLGEDWVQAGAIPEDVEDFGDWKQEWTTFDNIIKTFLELAPGSTICDPCGGWATTIVACIRRDVKMKCIGCEVLPDRHFEGQGEIEIAWQEIHGGRSKATNQPTQMLPSVTPVVRAVA